MRFTFRGGREKAPASAMRLMRQEGAKAGWIQARRFYGECDFVAKVKEFEPSEYGLLRENQIVFTCIHPAAHPEEVQALLDSKCIAFKRRILTGMARQTARRPASRAL